MSYCTCLQTGDIITGDIGRYNIAHLLLSAACVRSLSMSEDLRHISETTVTSELSHFRLVTAISDFSVTSDLSHLLQTCHTYFRLVTLTLDVSHLLQTCHTYFRCVTFQMCGTYFRCVARSSDLSHLLQTCHTYFRLVTLTSDLSHLL